MSKKFFTVAMATAIVLSTAGAASAAKQEPVVVSQEQVLIDNEMVTIETTQNNGQTIKSVKGKVKDKAKAAKHFDELFKKGKAQAAVFYNHSNSDTKTSADSRNSNAVNSSTASANWYYSNSNLKANVDVTGSQTGKWFGSSPYNADQMIFNQSFTFNGMSVSVSWPPSMTGSSTTANWQSQPVKNTWYSTASHSSLHANSYVALTSFENTDTTDIYVGTNIYRPTTYIYLN